jgi:hypothetical protein
MTAPMANAAIIAAASDPMANLRIKLPRNLRAGPFCITGNEVTVKVRSFGR